eukprot:3534444-Rhodomonas_salina.2
MPRIHSVRVPTAPASTNSALVATYARISTGYSCPGYQMRMRQYGHDQCWHSCIANPAHIRTVSPAGHARVSTVRATIYA